jgi:membrane protein YqaA with SNARE-associated domain
LTDLKFKIVDLLFLVLFCALTIVSLDFLINTSHQELIENLSKHEQFQNLTTGLIITFWVCLIGNLLPFPTPYTWVLCYSSLPFIRQNIYIPFLIGFVASLGCLVGEIGGYMIGRSGTKLMSEEKINSLIPIQKYLINHPKLAPILIFLAALTPLPDDLIVVPLGIIKYSPKKTFFFCWLGKLGFMLIFAYNLINICQLIGGESWILSILSLYTLLIFVYIIARVDITKILKFISKKRI